jgi:hypothetical protein
MVDTAGLGGELNFGLGVGLHDERSKAVLGRESRRVVPSIVSGLMTWKSAARPRGVRNVSFASNRPVVHTGDDPGGLGLRVASDAGAWNRTKKSHLANERGARSSESHYDLGEPSPQGERRRMTSAPSRSVCLLDLTSMHSPGDC